MHLIRTSLLLHAVVCIAYSAEPRITQLSKSADIPDRPPVIADLSGLNLPDIFFHSNPDVTAFGSNALLVRNLGNRIFDQPRFTNFRFSTDGKSDGLTYLAHISPDEPPVLFFNETNTASSTRINTPVSIAISQDGKIQPRSPIAPTNQSAWIPVDIDNDGISEFLEKIPDTGDESGFLIWDRQPDNTYLSTVIPTSESFSISLAIAIDLDNDGDLDLSTTSTNSDRALLERTESRSFKPTVHSVSGARDTQFTDLNGDDLPDLHNESGSPFTYFINQGDFNFDTAQSRVISPSSNASLKLVSATSTSGSQALLVFSGYVTDFIQLTTVRFSTWETVSNDAIDVSQLNIISADPETVALRDFDLDGHLDALISSVVLLPQPRTFFLVRRLSMAWGSADRFSTAAFIHPAPLSYKVITSADFDGDLDPDLIAGPDTDGRFAFLENTSEKTFPITRLITEINPPSSAPEGTYISKINSGDLDGDGFIDLAIDYEYFVAGSGYRNACGIAHGNGDGSFSPPVLHDDAFEFITQNPCGIEQLIDWDSDGDLDAIASGRWRENLGGRFDGTFRTLIGGVSVTDTFGNVTSLVHSFAGDLNGDGFPDIASLVYRLENIDNSDGVPSGEVQSTMAVAFNDGTGAISTIAEIPAKLASTDIFGNPIVGDATFVDMNSDGLPDLFTSELESFDIFGNAIPSHYWWRNPGGGSLDPQTWLKVPLDNKVFPDGKLLDFDGDRILEWVSPTGFLRPDPRGPISSAEYSFTSPVNFNSSSSILNYDSDLDGDIDFLFADFNVNLILVSNPIVDERSAITRSLIAQGVMPSLASPDKDADGDGRSNFTELFNRTNPLTPDQPNPNPFGMMFSRNTEMSRLSFSIPSDWSSFSIRNGYETSTDLLSWETIEPERVDQFPGGGGNVHLNVIFLETISDTRFYRLTGRHIVDPN